MTLNIFSKNKYYIRLYKNEIELTDLMNDKIISEKSEIEYSNQRLLISDFTKAENFIIDMFKKHKISTRNSTGIIQQIDMSEGGLSEVEKRILLEVFAKIGLKKIHIDESLKKLTKKQLDAFQ